MLHADQHLDQGMLAQQSCSEIEFNVALVFCSHTIFDGLDSGTRGLVRGFLINTRACMKKSKGRVDTGNRPSMAIRLMCNVRGSS